MVGGDGDIRGNANLYEPGATQLSDLSKRIADADALGLDVQLVISTFFIGVELDNPLAEAALCRSYNRFMAERLQGSTDRLPWVARVPLRTPDRAFDELEFAKKNGAAGVQFRGVEHGLYLSDPYFWPVYQRAQDLDLTIVVHIGSSVRRTENLPVGSLIPQPAYLMAGFMALLGADYEVRFPRLRWLFVEGGSTWVPAVLQAHSRFAAGGPTGRQFLHLSQLAPSELEAKNIFVACEADEDLEYLVSIVGENVLCAGTDYGHNDMGTEVGSHRAIAASGLSKSVVEKIVDTNGRRSLGIPASYRPIVDPYFDAIPPNMHRAGSEHAEPILVHTS
jgi:predicted TIM-barrel fold metal-dependent hydrolase